VPRRGDRSTRRSPSRARAGDAATRLKPTRIPLNTSALDKITNTVRQAGEVLGTSWMGPGTPPAPVPAAASSSPRRYDYPIGINTQSQPRAGSLARFDQLRALAENCDIVRLMIERRKRQMGKLKLAIKPVGNRKVEGLEGAIEEMMVLFKRPDGEHDYETWQSILLEDRFVLDAATIEPRYNLGGKLARLDPIDGATIIPRLDQWGRRPVPPEVAYQQKIKGVIVASMTSDELIQKVAVVRTDKLHGFPPVEQVLIICNMAIRRELHMLEFYTAGTAPDMIMEAPTGWTPEQIAEFEADFHEMLAGNTEERRKLRVMPPGSKITETKTELIKNPIDEWLVRVGAFAFGISPAAFLQQVIRATSETLREEATAEGLDPDIRWMRNLLDLIIQVYAGHPELEATLVDDIEPDPKTELENKKLRQEMGLTSLDEMLAEEGKPGIGVGTMIKTPGGWKTPEQFMQGTSSTAPVADPLEPEPAFSRRRIERAAPTVTVKPKKNSELPGAETDLTVGVADVLEAVGPGVAAAVVAQYPEPEETEAVVRAEKALTEKQIDEIVDALDLTGFAAMVGVADAQIARVARKAAGDALLQVNITDAAITDRANAKVVAYARKRAAELVGMKYNDVGDLIVNPRAALAITDTTRTIVRVEITKALKHGMTRDQLAKSIMEEGFSKARARKIAQTELSLANADGHISSWESSGVVKGKKWLLSNQHWDKMPEGDICNVNAGRGVIPLRASFKAIDGSPIKMHPAHPECECGVAAEVLEEALA